MVGGQSALASEHHRPEVPTGTQNAGEVLSGQPALLWPAARALEALGRRASGASAVDLARVSDNQIL